MTSTADIAAEASRLRAGFEASGAAVVEPPILQPAETLLDLYGEDIRARAYVTSDPMRGEQMLRPDFTLPVVQKHMREGAEPARYTYSGPVFRRQENDPDRDNEYLQVGYEVFDRAEPTARDAEVLAAIAQPLEGLPIRVMTGDIGLLTSAVSGLETTDRRKAALMRHIWRPRRFRALLDRFSRRAPVSPTREQLLEAADPFADIAPVIGLRGRDEIEARIDALREDASVPPIEGQAVDLIDALLKVRETLPFALERLRDLAVDLPSISASVERLAERMEALAESGLDPATLEFEGSYGRSSMEYYDGFVFGISALSHPHWPPVASGGRYDALTAALGGGASIPAVGGVLRPGLIARLREAAQ